jgi:hypothetical protein
LLRIAVLKTSRFLRGETKKVVSISFWQRYLPLLHIVAGSRFGHFTHLQAYFLGRITGSESYGGRVIETLI